MKGGLLHPSVAETSQSEQKETDIALSSLLYPASDHTYMSLALLWSALSTFSIKSHLSR